MPESFCKTAIQKKVAKEVKREAAAFLNSKSVLYGGGKHVVEFERDLSRFLGNAPTAAVSSGTDGLMLAMKAAGVGSGDEVIVPAFSFVSTASSVVWIGAKPVFADICIDNYAMDHFKIKSLITERTRAIIVVHLFGYPTDVAPILKIAKNKKIVVIEDAAQSFGAKRNGRLAGTIADLGVFSFSPSKPLGSFGNGGAVASRNREFINRIKLLRRYGGNRPYVNVALAGVNAELDDFQSIVLRVKLSHIREISAAYQRLADIYHRTLAEIDHLILPKAEPEIFRSWYRYPIRTAARDGLFSFLRARFSGTKLCPMLNYPVPLPRLNAFSAFVPNSRKMTFPVSEKAASETLVLPMGIDISEKDAGKLAKAVKEFYR